MACLLELEKQPALTAHVRLAACYWLGAGRADASGHYRLEALRIRGFDKALETIEGLIFQTPEAYGGPTIST